MTFKEAWLLQQDKIWLFKFVFDICDLSLFPNIWFTMNKIFIALAIYGIAIAYAQPTHDQCEVQTTAALNLANLVERISKGEGLYLSHLNIYIR